jgi:hypothetical protein
MLNPTDQQIARFEEAMTGNFGSGGGFRGEFEEPLVGRHEQQLSYNSLPHRNSASRLACSKAYYAGCPRCFWMLKEAPPSKLKLKEALEQAKGLMMTFRGSLTEMQ